MAQQEEGWPLGLRPLNARINGMLMRSPDLSASSSSLSFNNLLTASPTSSSISSSDLHSQSTGSFFHERSKTLGSLIGVSSIIEVSRRSTTTRVPRRTISSDHKLIRDDKKSFKSKHWLFSLCSNLTTDAVTAATNTPPCLAHFLEAERRAAATNTRRNRVPLQYHGPDDYSPVHYLTISNSNSLFVNGLVAPHKSPAAPGAANGGIRSGTRVLEDDSSLGCDIQKIPSVLCIFLFPTFRFGLTFTLLQLAHTLEGA